MPRTSPEAHAASVAPSPVAPALAVSDLHVHYRTERGVLEALRGVDFEVGRGRVVGLVGESGCGKSTVIDTVLRLMSDNSRIVGGSVRLEGRELLTLTESEMRALRGDRMAVIFQDPTASLHPVLSIGAQMVDVQHRAPESRREKLALATAMLARVGIADPEATARRYAHELSGGMRQRVAIAMALLCRPALLIADEPTSALDATTKAQILYLLEQLQAEIGCAVLLVSHHLGAIARLADDVVVMYAGEVVERGPVGAIFHHPAHPYTRRLLACDPSRIVPGDRRLPTIPGGVPDLLEIPPGCIFAPRCRDAFERCTQERPERLEVTSGHAASCHLVDTEPRSGGR